LLRILRAHSHAVVVSWSLDGGPLCVEATIMPASACEFLKEARRFWQGTGDAQ
jgi:predicted nucleic acid binding AN1-type Zn finger protein